MPAGEPQAESGAAAGVAVKRQVRAERAPGQTFEAAAIGRGFRRTFRYADDLFETLREYTLGAGPAFGVSLAWFPTARLGVAGEIATSVGLDSQTTEGIEFPTRALHAVVGLRVRHPLGRHELRFALDGGLQDFTVDDAADMTPRPAIPNVAYRFARLGAEVRLALTESLQAGAGAGYRYILSSGEIEEDDFFPRLSVHGVDASAWLGYRLGANLEARIGLAVERYFYAMNPEPGDPLVAGGAVDQYVSGHAAAVYRF
jgi:hypothetical protein